MMDGGAVVDGPAIDTAQHSPRRWSNGADKALTASRDHELLEAMRASPTASASVLAGVLGVGVGSVISRWQRLSARGLITKDRRGHWRAVEREHPPDAVEQDEGSISEFETQRPTSLFVYSPRIWVNHINYFVDLVFNPSPFACRRYG